MVPWTEIIKDPRFADLPQSDQVMLRDEWFQANAVPMMKDAGLPDHVIQEERDYAVSKFDNGQGYVSSFLSSAGRGLATTATGAVAGAGVVLGSDSLEQTGRDMTQSVNESLPVNTSLEKTNFAGNVVGNVGGFIASGGAGGFIGKGLGAAAKGAEIASLGTGFLGGAAGAAQEADQYGITGGDRYMRALGGGLTEVATEKLLPFGGMGTELRAVSKIPGLSSVAGQRTGSFLKDVASETGEEVASQITGNALTTALAPDGVVTPGLMDGTLEAAAGGALGGGLFGGINLINAPSERIASLSQVTAEAAGDPAAAAVLAEAQAAAQTMQPRLVPVIAPEITDIAAPDATINDPLTPPAVEDLPPPAGFENPLPPLLTPLQDAPMTPEAVPVETPVATEVPAAETAPVETPVAETPVPVEDAAVPEVAPVEVTPAAEAALVETPVVPPTREETLTAQAEQVFPTPEIPEDAAAQLAEDDKLIDRNGPISIQEAQKMVEALRELGATTLPVQVNDGENNKYRGSIQYVDGQPTILLNRNAVTADTPIHEAVGHAVLPNLRESNPDLFAAGAGLLQGSPLMEAVRRRYTASGFELDDAKLLEETMATAYGNDSAKFWRQYAGNPKLVRAIKQWLAKVKLWVEEHLASKGVDPNMTVRQFNDKVTRRILAGQLREATRTGVPSQPDTTNAIQKDGQEDSQGQEQGQVLNAAQESAPAPPPVQEQAPAAPAPPARPSFTESLLADLPEKARAAWSESDLKAAEEFAAGDSGALERINGDIKRKRVIRHKGNLDADDGSVFSIPSAVDAEYMAAVQSGDVERQQDLVDAAAKAAGYNVGPVFHGTPNKPFNKFDKEKTGYTDDGYLGKGFYFDSDKGWAIAYSETPFLPSGKNVKKKGPWEVATLANRSGAVARAFLSGRLMQVEEVSYDKREDVRNALGLPFNATGDEVREEAIKKGFNGVSYNRYKTGSEVVVFEPNQIKSADPVTRDDQGNVIPLSQRFKPTSDDIRYSLIPPGQLKPSGLSANQRGSIVRNLVAGVVVQGETFDGAYDQANAIFTRNEKEDFTFDQHLAALNSLINAEPGTTLNMTPGAYFGMLSASMTNMERNEDLPASERDAARRNNDILAGLVAQVAAAGGQFVKGFDQGLKIANNPRMKVDLDDRLTPFDGNQNRRKRFDAEKAAVANVLDGVTMEEFGKMAETTLLNTLSAGVNDTIRGEHSADEGVATANESLEPAAQEAEAADFSWLQGAVDSLGGELQQKVNEWLLELEVMALLQQTGDFSLTPNQSRSVQARERVAAILASGINRAQAITQQEAKIAAVTGEMAAIKAKTPQREAAKPEDLKGMVIGRLNDALEKLISPRVSKAKKGPTQEQIASAISAALLAKAGLGPFPKGVSGDMALALGLMLNNQSTAAEALNEIHTALQNDPRTQDTITKEKLKTFMQLAIGRTFDTASGASDKAAPYTEKQMAAVLRSEMARLETSMREVAMDASLQRDTAAKLEAALRSPERGFDKILSPAALDATVAAVLAEYNKTAAQRAADIQRQQAEESVRARMKEDLRQQKAQDDLEIKQAKRDADIAQKAVRDAMAEEARATAQWEKEQADQEQRNKNIAEKEVRDAMAREAKAAAKWKEEQLRSAKKAVLDTMKAYKSAQDKQAAAQARADKRETEAAIREAAAEAKNKKIIAVRAMRNKRKAARAEIRKAKGLPEPLTFEEKQTLMGVKQEKIIDYLAREFGFDLTGLMAVARREDRAAGVHSMTLRLADALGLNPQQAEQFMKPVMAEAMKNLDAKRQKEVERRINDAIKRASKRNERTKKANQMTEAQKLVRLAMLGGLSAKNIEKIMLNDMGAEAFSDEFRAKLEDIIQKANDANLPASTRADYNAIYLEMIRSARGASAIGLAGEWVMSNLFMALGTFKVNLVWGGAKSFADSMVYASTAAHAAANPGGPRLPGLTGAILKAGARTFGKDLQYQAQYLLKTGKSPLTNDKLTQFSQSEMELIATMPETEIRAWINGKPLSPAWQKAGKTLARFAKYTRRVMASTDLLWRAQAYEMQKATAIAKVIVQQGGEIPNTTAAWTKAIDDALYGGDFQQAKEDAYRQVDSEIAQGTVPPEQRGIRFGEILDSKLGENIGVDQNGKPFGLTEDERANILTNSSEEAKRWTVANETEGILGVLSNQLLSAVRDVPGLKFLLPAIRMPIGAFSQTLDWTPYGFARAQAIKWNDNRSSSVTNAVWNRHGIKKSWPLPLHGVPSERAVDLRTKALIGSSMMLTMFILAFLDLDKDEDEADFYITGKGPENPQQNKLWREKGNRPFMVRAGGVALNYQESPIFAALSIIGAWSDVNRYGKMDDATSDKIAYTIQKVMTGFGDAAVLKNMQDALGSITGGGSYTSGGAVEAAGKWTSRTAGVLLFPRVGSEINTILFGPQDGKQIGWAGRALANVPFTPALFDKPALNFFGESIHTVRGDAWGEVAPILAHRITPQLTDDPQMQFVAKMGANPLTTTRRFKDDTQVMDDYEFVRTWAADSGKAVRTWLTPERMEELTKLKAVNAEDAVKKFDDALREIRLESLKRISKGRIEF